MAAQRYSANAKRPCSAVRGARQVQLWEFSVPQFNVRDSKFRLSLSLMTAQLADILNAKLVELRSEGFEVRRIFASSANIERLFCELGDSAILLDCDPGQDRAWYGQYELAPADAEGVMIMYCRGEECWIRDLVSTGEGAEALRAGS